jgi:hypothetical protein
MKKSRPSIRMFLSHRYKSPEVNLYFFDLFSKMAEIQFEVDVGTKATCVTRLERFVRDTDAFIGIYPYPDPNEPSPSPAQKQDASKYFRLELDLAMRSRKPALVLYDSRYGALLECPPSLNAHTFDMREILAQGGKPSREKHRRLFEEFLAAVNAFAAFQNSKRVEPYLENLVGLLVPESGGAYTLREREAVRDVLTNAGCDIIDLPWPPRLTLKYIAQFERADWIVADIGATACATGVPAFLHGEFYPLTRLLCTREGETSGLESTLFGGTEVGYPKDIVRWEDEASLRAELEKRIGLIKAPAMRISTLEQGIQYFRTAALRNEAVFLSYAGSDRDIGAEISAELKKRFQKVFDYRDGTSIVTGKPWLDEVFESLAASVIGIPLLSSNYVASENCLHEAREMFSRADQKKMTVLPAKIRKEEFDLPPWAQSTQYIRSWNFSSASALADQLIHAYDKNRAARLA